MKKPFFARYSLLVLMVVFFLAPFAMRGARMAVQRMKNDVKDWLPSDFVETRELDWFRERFLGEQFVVVSWEGCTGTTDDESFMTFVDKFYPEVPPSERLRRLESGSEVTTWHASPDADVQVSREPSDDEAQTARKNAPRKATHGVIATGALQNVDANDTSASTPSADQARISADAMGETASVGGDDELALRWPLEVRRENYVDPRLQMYVRQLTVFDLPPAAERLGNKLGLFYTENKFTNWGGQDEKWILGHGDQWYYLTPTGDVYRWRGSSSIIQPMWTAIKRILRGPSVDGDYIASLGPLDGPWYYEDPQRLSAQLFKTVTTGPGMLHELTKPGGVLDNDPERAMKRLEGSLFGPDGKQTCLVVTLTEAAKQDLRLAVGRGILGKPQGRLLTLAAEAGIHPPARPVLAPPPLSWLLASDPEPTGPVIKLGGPSVDNVAIDEEGQITLVRLVGLSLLVGLGLSYASFRSVNVTIMVFLVGGLSALASLSFVYWGGTTVDAVLMSMPSLIYVLGLSGAVHIVNYYRDSVAVDGIRRAAGVAVSHGWKPCTLAAITTALGLLSLFSSNIQPIRKFGLYSAIGVLATLVLLFTYLPAALQTWPPRRFVRRKPGAELKSSFEHFIERMWRRIGTFILDNYVVVLAAMTLLMIGVGYGIRHIDTDVQLLKMFDANAKIIRDYTWLEKNLGKLVPMEVIVRVDKHAYTLPPELPAAPESAAKPEPESDTTASATRPVTSQSATAKSRFPLNFLERMEVVSYIEEVLAHRFGDEGQQIVGNAMSPVTFAVEMPGSGASFSKVAKRGGISRSLEEHRDEFLRSDYLRVDQEDQAELWRISLRLGALSNVDYGAFVRDLQETIEPVLAAYKYREQILTALEKERDDAGLRKAKVYLVGARFGRSPSALQLAPKSPSGGIPAAEDTNAWSETAVFAKILGRLLINAGVDLHDWHDPRFELPDDWATRLEQQDCVVLVDSRGPYDINQVEHRSKRFVDARKHNFTSLNGTANERHEPIAAIYTGLVPVVYKAQRTLLDSLIVSTIWAFVMIAAVMMLVVRNMRAGLVSMLPNVFPVLLVFGFMGWHGTLVDIGSMMTASVAMGIAVDDTIHFLTWFRRGLDEGLDRRSSILQAYERVGMAMTQTTLIGGLGLSIFAFSTFTPTQRFGTLMLALLAAALVGDLFYLPALLISPLGRVFDGSRRQRKKSVQEQDAPASNNHNRPGFDGPTRVRPYPVSTQLTQNRSINP